MKVYFVETFEGVRGRLGRGAIVDVDASTIEEVQQDLQHYLYEVVSEPVPGARRVDLAIQIAKENCPEGMPLFVAGAFKVWLEE